jgi:nitroreductase
MRIQDEPLPTGSKALKEAALLGRALVGLGTDDVEQDLGLRMAWESAGLPHRDITVNVVFRRNGQPYEQVRFTIDANGAGLHHGRDGGVPGTEIVVDMDERPVTERFMKLRDYLAAQRREADQIASRTGQPVPPYAASLGDLVERIAMTVHRRRPDEPDPVLVEIVDGLQADGQLEPGRLSPDVAEGLRDQIDRLRAAGSLDTWSAAAALVAACLPPILAAMQPNGIEQLTHFTRYFGFSVLELRVSPWQALYGPAHKAIREGFATAVAGVARQLLDEAERLRDEGLGGPSDRDTFSSCLFKAQPYALAAAKLYSFLNDPPLETTAEETLARIRDGIIHQWLDFDDADLYRDRDAIRAARRHGDHTAVQLILREGEMALKRPRSVRTFLLAAEENNMSVEDSSFDVADAFGNDFVYLAPPGEHRFDPASVAVVLGALLLHAALKGIASGVEETAKGLTTTLLDRIGAAVRSRLPGAIQRAFRRDTPVTVSEAQAEAGIAAKEGRTATNGIEAATIDAIVRAVAIAIRAELATVGLPGRPSDRVADAMKIALAEALQGQAAS